MFFMLAAFSFTASFAQDGKEVQARKEAESKKLQEAQLIEKIKANPKMAGKIKLTPEEKLVLDQRKDEVEKSILNKKEADEAAKRIAEKRNPSLTGIEYKVITTGMNVEYIITNNGQVVYRQEITAQGSLYSKQVEAEKEAIYASNLLRANPNYPSNSIKGQIKSLSAGTTITRTFQSNNPQRINADYTFNGGGGTIPSSGNATPYPATITVSGVPAGATVKEIKISGLNHTWPNDIDMAVQSPSGTNVYLMSDAGGSVDLIGVDYTFSDAAATGLQDEAYSPSGSYKPSNFEGSDNFPAPGPGAAVSSVTLSTFGNGNQNGTWNLFVVDDLGGDFGDWASWSITFTDPAATCFPITITSQPSNATICSGGNGSFSVTATPNGVSYNWQVNTGSGFTYLTNGGVYSGVNTATLTLTNPTLAMTGYQYRCVVTCSQGGLPEISNPASLTVLASPGSPAVSPTSAAICPGGSQFIAVGGGAQSSFSNLTGITIPAGAPGTSSGIGAPYPSAITVAGLPAQTLVKSVTINGLTHTFPDDIDIILKSPSGATVILMSDAGGGDDLSGLNYTFDDGAASLLLDGAFNASGTYKPTNYGTGDNWPAPGPGTVNQATPTLGSLGAGNNNGTWELYVYDDAGGDYGALTSWSITFEGVGSGIFYPSTGLFTDAGLTTPYTGTPVSTVYASPGTTTTYGVTISNGTCISAPTNVIVTVNQPPVLTAQPSNGAACIGSVKTFSVTATGAGLTYQWQVDAGSGYANITTGSPTNPSGFIYTGQTTATLSINTLMATMTGYKYRVIVSGSCTPSVTSGEVVLAVNSLPAISVSKSSSCSPMTLTASGASTYSWAPSAGLSATTGATVSANPTANTVYTVTGTSAAGCVNTSQVDVKFTPPTPVIAPTAPIICSTAVQQLSITSSSLPPVANTTSSGAISVPIGDLLPPAISTLNVAGVAGAVQSISVNLNITHTYDGDITLNLKAPNGSIYNLSWENGGSGDNYTNTTFSSTAANIIYTGTAPYTGTFAAEGASGVGIAPNLSNVTAWSNLFSTPNGAWSLIVTDLYGGDNGTIDSWSITINYAAPDAAVWTPVTGLFTNSAGTTPYVAGTPAATVYASPTSTTTYSATVTNTSTETRTFSTGGTVTIPGTAPGSTSSGAGSPYPATVSVSGLPANAILKSVTVKGMKHSFPDDIDMLLQSPTGTNVVLMSDVGGGTDETGQNYTFDDAASGLMADAALNASGTYKPTNYGASDTYPAPIGSITQATPTLASFTGDPNGTWNLYVRDEFSSDIGVMSSWELVFTIPTATNCTSTPRTVTVTVQSPIVFTAQPQNRTACQNGTVTFTAAATGTITTTQWQQSTNGGATWTDIAGATTTTLTLTNVQPSQNGYRYRIALSNAGCGIVNSTAAILTVNPLPTVNLTLNPGGQTALKPGLQTTVTVTSTPAGASYQWFVNGVAQPQITGSSYVVDAYHIGTYTVRVTDVNGCVNTSAGVTFTAIPTSQLFIYPNPTTGAYYVTYYTRSPMPVTISVIDMKGRRIVQRQEPTTGSYTRFDFTADKLASGVYVIEFRDASENLLAAGRLVVTR
jgi:subtilisin-like proprotein convertase family protein